MNLYTIVFEDSSVFKGGDLNAPNWLNIPNKKIRSIFYSLPLGDMLCLAGYKKYYHFVEVCKDINGDKAGQVQLEFAYLIGKNIADYRIYKMSLKNGQLEIINTNQNDELIKQLNPIGWK